MCKHEWDTEICERRWFAGGELYEESFEYVYCVKCGEVKNDHVEEKEIEF